MSWAKTVKVPLRRLSSNLMLAWRLARREFEARYRGSALGLLWGLLTPLLTVASYSFVFTVVFQPRWVVPEGEHANFVLLLYSGVLVFSIFAESVGRAATLVLDHPAYVKKVVFPLGILAIVAAISALLNFLVGSIVMAAIYLIALGPPPLTVIFLPVVLAPLVLFTLGLTWILSALGVYLRDLKYFITVAISMLMFLSPIFFPVSAVPEHVRGVLYANPLTPVLEASKDLLFWGRIPPLDIVAINLGVSLVVAVLGYFIFAKLRPGFADVI